MEFDHDSIEELEAVSAAEIREVLLELRAERDLARRTSLSTVGIYMDDLEQELEAVDYLYVLTAVTELATARAREDGPLLG